MLALFTPKLLKRFLDFIWWLVLIVLSIMLLSFLYDLIWAKEINISLPGFPIVYEDIIVSELELGSHLLATSNGKLEAFMELKPSGRHDLTHPLFFYTMMSFVLNTAIFFYTLFLARKFLGNIIDKQFFVHNNITLLTRMGHWGLIAAALTVLSMVVFRLYLYYHDILPEGVSFNTGDVIEIVFDGLIWVIGCYMFAGIFQYGRQLKEDHELTV